VTRLILASQSPARTKLLADAGIRHSVLVSDVDEEAVQARYGITDPHDTALLLARAKAEAVAALPEAEGALVLGCDSVFEFDGEAHGKPYTAAVARERMLRMSGNTGVLHTGHWLVDCRDTTPDQDTTPPGSGATLGSVASAEVHFMDMEPEEIDAAALRGVLHHRRIGRGVHPEGQRGPARRRRTLHFHAPHAPGASQCAHQ
jgi:septum formation protein